MEITLQILGLRQRIQTCNPKIFQRYYLGIVKTHVSIFSHTDTCTQEWRWHLKPLTFRRNSIWPLKKEEKKNSEKARDIKNTLPSYRHSSCTRSLVCSLFCEYDLCSLSKDTHLPLGVSCPPCALRPTTCAASGGSFETRRPIETRANRAR